MKMVENPNTVALSLERNIRSSLGKMCRVDRLVVRVTQRHAEHDDQKEVQVTGKAENIHVSEKATTTILEILGKRNFMKVVVQITY